jgi:DNA-binding NarL/FixJ family response regulator
VIIVSGEHKGGIQNGGADHSPDSPTPPLTPVSEHEPPPSERSSAVHKQVYPNTYGIPARNVIISVGLIDEHSFTRQCITRSLRELDDTFAIYPFASCEDCLLSEKSYDVILYHAREAVASLDSDNERFQALKRLLQVSPVIILSAVDGPNLVIRAFKGGARGFIPTTETTIEMVIEIIRLVKAGGTFVPPSSLCLGTVNGEHIPRPTIPTYQFTTREMAVLERLSLGKANKTIAYQLQMSESTVKVHIKSIMNKLNAKNRTEVVCRVHDLTGTGTRQ